MKALQSAFDATIDFQRGDVIAAKGEAPFVGLLMAGFLCRRRTLTDGAQQLLPVAIPGDFYGALDLSSEPLNFEIIALSRGTIATATFPAIGALLREHPGIERAWARARRLEESISRERIVNLGGRAALSRVAHFFCEFATRTSPAGATPSEAVFFPLNQAEMAQSCGLSVPHLSRVLKDLRSRSLARTRFERVYILNWTGLAHLADFDTTYLKDSLELDAQLAMERRSSARLELPGSMGCPSQLREQ